MRILVCLVLTASMAMLACGCREGAETQETAPGWHRELLQVEVAPVTTGDISETVELVGNLIPSRRAIIVAEVDGVIQAMPKPEKDPVVIQYAEVREVLPQGLGSVVHQGDVLVRLDATDYRRALKVAEANLEKARCDLADLLAWERPEEIRRLEALTEEAKASAERAKSEFERTKELLEHNAVSRSEHEENLASVRRTSALLAHAEAKLEIAKAGPTKEEVAVARATVAAAEAEVEHTRWRVEKCTITAPYDAVITDRYMDEGDRVTAFPRVEILEIMDVRFLMAQVGVPERYGDKIQLLDKALVRVKGSPDDIPGLVVRINDKIDPENRTFRVRVAIDNATRRFRVGQFARVLLTVGTAAETLTIPRQAITYSGGQPQVFVVADSKVRLTPIQLGIDSGQRVEVVAGLAVSEQVVVRDPAVLSDGMQVKVASPPRVAQRSSRSPQ